MIRLVVNQNLIVNTIRPVAEANSLIRNLYSRF